MPVREVKFDHTRPDDFELTVGVGDSLREDGLTRVTLDGTGRLTVEHERPDGKEAPVRGELPREEAGSVLTRASQFPWERRFPARPGLPDEAVVQWSLQDRKGATVAVKAWLREVEKDPVMTTVLATLRKHVERVSRGERYL